MSYNRPGRGQPRRPRRQSRQQQEQAHQRARRRQGGFTLVEILTAVAIIAILISMAFLGFKYVGGSTKHKSTEVALHNLRGMLAEYEGQGARMRDLLKAYNDASNNPQPLGVTAGPIDPDNIHLLTSDDVMKTAYEVMPRLRAIPQNKAVLDALPPEQIYPRRWDPTKSYQVGERVQSGNQFYKCQTAVTVGSTPPLPPDQDTGAWGTKPDAPNFLVLDPWGVPIVFVPPAGAVNLTDGGGTHVVGGTGLTAPKQAPDRKGYFMSAGEDRDFSKADDNVYSFENK